MNLHALWSEYGPNVVSPSAWTIVALVIGHVKAARQRERHHEDLKQHVTATAGGADGNGD